MNTIEMYGDVAKPALPSAGAVVLPVWRVRGQVAGFAPITASGDAKHKSTRVSVPGCRGRT